MADTQTPAVSEAEKPTVDQPESENAATEKQAPAAEEKSQVDSVADAKVDAPKEAESSEAAAQPAVATEEAAPPAEEKNTELTSAASAPSNGAAKPSESADEPKKSVESDQVYKKKDNSTDRSVYHKRNTKQDGRKSDFSKLPESSDPDEIRRQVEFYFSDSNLPLDKFLFNTIEGYKNKPVDLKIVTDFKRMRRFQPFSAVVEALKASEMLEVLEGDKQIRRKEPLPESVGTTYTDSTKAAQHFQDKTVPRSIYVKGFGFDTEEATTQVDLEKFFDAYGTVKSLRLRRNYNGAFKGSVFVEFDSEETQQAFLALDPKPKWKDQDLLIKSKKAYCDDKIQEKIDSGDLKPEDVWANKGGNNNARGGARGRGRGGQRGGNDHRGRGRGGSRGRGGRGGRDRDNHDRGDRNLRSRENKDKAEKKDGENGGTKEIEMKDAKAPGGDNWKERRDDFQQSEDFRGTKRAAGDDAGDKEVKKAKADDA